MSPLEAQIVATAKHRLLANNFEFKHLRGLGTVSVGCLARLIALNQVRTIRRNISVADLVLSLDYSKEVDRKKSNRVFADLTLAAPLLLYAEPEDGRPVMIDGRQRLEHLLALARPTVSVAVLERSTVERFLIADPPVSHYRSLDATEHWPIGAQPFKFQNATEVQIIADYENKYRGGQELSRLSRHLGMIFYYFANNLLDLEDFIYRNLPSESSIDVRVHGRSLPRREVDRLVHDALIQDCKFIPSLNTIKNKADAAVRYVTDRFGHVGMKRFCAAAWRDMYRNNEEDLENERFNAKAVCLQIWKLRWRAQTLMEASRGLVDQELSDRHFSRRHIVSKIEGQDRYFETSLNLAEQISVSLSSGENANRVYQDFNELDPLVGAYAFPYHYRNSLAIDVDAGMVETALHRRALAILRQRDAISTPWDDLFDRWRVMGVGDTTLLKLLEAIDCRFAHYGPVSVPVDELRP